MRRLLHKRTGRLPAWLASTSQPLVRTLIAAFAYKYRLRQTTKPPIFNDYGALRHSGVSETCTSPTEVIDICNRVYDNCKAFPDLTIMLDSGRKLRVHRAIVCVRN